MDTISNVSDYPSIYYVLHFVQGVAQYKAQDGTDYKIFLNEDTLRLMDKSFAGRPIYIQHVDNVDFNNMQKEADGYVVESFFNAADSAHWAKVIIISDKAKELIKQGWKVSNAYNPTKFGPGGKWHGVDYIKEIVAGEFEHLALTDRPRYSESVILTPEKFKEYNINKLAELSKVANSNNTQGEDMGLFSKKEEIKEEKKNDEVKPEVKEEVKEEKKDAVKEEPKKEITMETLHDLLNCIKSSLDEMKPKKEEVKEEKKDMEDPKEHEKAKAKIEELEKHEDKSIAEAKKNNFESIINAELTINKNPIVAETSRDKVMRGKARYGSNK